MAALVTTDFIFGDGVEPADEETHFGDAGVGDVIGNVVVCVIRQAWIFVLEEGLRAPIGRRGNDDPKVKGSGYYYRSAPRH